MNFDYDIDSVHLRTHEVNYELKIRGITPSRADILQRRKLLRELLKTEIGRPNLVYKTPDFNFELEKSEIDGSLKTLQELVNDFDNTKPDTYKRFKSRYKHVMGRLLRFEVAEDNQEISDYKNDKIVTVGAMLADVHDILSKSSQKTEEPISTNAVSKSIPIFKWGVTFDGSAKQESVDAFLQRVEELRVARNTTKEAVYRSAVDLFVGEGLLWYRAIKSSVHDWDSLANALRRDFLPADYEEELWDVIRNKIQGESEKITIYIATMQNLFSKLDRKPREEERLRIIKKNILPEYQVQIALLEIISVQQLSETCRKLENARLSAKKFLTPSKKTVATLVSDSTHNAQQATPSTSKSKYHTPITSEVKCWRCNKTGHLRKNCKQKITKNLRCYACGKAGVIKPNCVCQKNVKPGNAQ